MARQSTAPAVLLTRPASQGARFAALLRERFGAPEIVESPLIAPEFLDAKLPAQAFAGIVLSSETGAEAARRLGVPACPAYCVGARTAAAARAAGFAAEAVGGDADALVAALLSRRPPGPLLHLHGEDTRGDIALRLSEGGIPVQSLAVYAQRPLPLSAEAKALLGGTSPVIVPLFSPRSAALFAASTAASTAPIWVAALSPAVAAGLGRPVARMVVAARPDAESMADALAAYLPLHRGA